MGFRDKRKSRYGPPLKPVGTKASRFVGVKMTPKMFDELTALVTWAGRRNGATQSSVIVALIHEAWSRGDPRPQKQKPLPEEREAATASADQPPPAPPVDRDATIAAAIAAVGNATGKKEKRLASKALDAVLASFRPPDPPFGRKS